MNMEVVIIEDEIAVANRLVQLLNQIDPKILVLEKIRTVRDAIKWLGQNHPDLIFMDIHLADGLSFKIFDQIEIKTPIIFTTAYDQYAIKAFKVNSIDYLLKPINIDELTQSIQKFKKISENNLTKIIDYQSIIKAIGDKKAYKKRFTINIGRKIKIIETSSIAYFYIMNKSNFILTNENKSFDIDYSLDKLEDLMDPEIFFRIHRRYLIHINSIKSIYTLSKSRIKIELTPPANEDIIISYQKSGKFKKWLGQ